MKIAPKLRLGRTCEKCAEQLEMPQPAAFNLSEIPQGRVDRISPAAPKDPKGGKVTSLF